MNVPKLTLRILLEGAPGAGVSTVLGELETQVFGKVRRSTQRLDTGRKLRLLTYESDRYGNSPIRIEMVTLGECSSVAQGTARRSVDAIVVVIESTPEGVVDAAERLADLAGDIGYLPLERMPRVSLVAHQQDRDDALTPARILTMLNLPEDTAIAPTSRDFGGMQFAVTLAVRSVTALLEAGEQLAVLTRRPSTADELFCEFAPMLCHVRRGAGAPPSDSLLARPAMAAPNAWPAPGGVGQAQRPSIWPAPAGADRVDPRSRGIVNNAS